MKRNKTISPAGPKERKIGYKKIRNDIILVIWNKSSGEVDSISMIINNTFHPVWVKSILSLQRSHCGAEDSIRSRLQEWS